jgi:hypothetical protein
MSLAIKLSDTSYKIGSNIITIDSNNSNYLLTYLDKPIKWLYDDNRLLYFKHTITKHYLTNIITGKSNQNYNITFIDNNIFNYSISNLYAKHKMLLQIENYLLENGFTNFTNKHIVFARHTKHESKKIENSIFITDTVALLVIGLEYIIKFDLDLVDKLVEYTKQNNITWSVMSNTVLSRTNANTKTKIRLYDFITGKICNNHIFKNNDYFDMQLKNIEIQKTPYKLHDKPIETIELYKNSIDNPELDYEGYNHNPYYGSCNLNTPIQLYIKYNNTLIPINNYTIKLTNSYEKPAIIYKNSLEVEANNFSFMVNGNLISQKLYYIILASAFPDIIPDETIDHINDNPNDNRAYNLRWLSTSDNSSKGQIKSIDNSIKNGGKNGKAIIIRVPDEYNSKDYNKSLPFKTFKNINLAAKYLQEHLKIENTLDSIESKIRRSIKNNNLKAYGYYFETFNNDLEIEDWRELPDKCFGGNIKVYISSLGRAKDQYGKYYMLYQPRDQPKYRRLHINGIHIPIHRAVWYAFIGDIPNNLVVMHDDTAPLNEDGSYRNYLIDLSLGTQSENMISYHKHKNLDKGVNITPFDYSFTTQVEHTPTPRQELPKYIQYIKATEQRGSHFVISRHMPNNTKGDIRSSQSKKISDTDKYNQIYQIYLNLLK